MQVQYCTPNTCTIYTCFTRCPHDFNDVLLGGAFQLLDQNHMKLHLQKVFQDAEKQWAT